MFPTVLVISLNEFRYNPDLKVGDSVDVMIDVREDKTGQLILSHRKARTLMAWDKVNAAHKSQEIVTGFVKCRTKGGMIVDVFGIEAFLPGSQIDVKPIRDYDQYVNKKMEFKIVKINHEFKIYQHIRRGPFRVGDWFWVHGLGEGLVLMVQKSGFRVQCLGFRV